MGTLAQNGFSNFDCTHLFLNNSDIFLLVIYHFVNFELILCLEDLCLMFFAIFNFQVKIINKPSKAKKNIPLLTITWQKNNESVGRQNVSFLFIYLFIFLTGEKKAEHVFHLHETSSLKTSHSQEKQEQQYLSKSFHFFV